MNNTESETVTEILAAKGAAGPDAWLWLQADAGDCILWASEEAADNNNASNALQRWVYITAEEAAALIDSGEIDEIN